MKSSLAAGLEKAQRVLVDESRVISFMGDDCRVYATPHIINDVEYACRNLLLPHLDPGEDSVGTRVNVEHVGPALLGDEAVIDVRLTEIEGRRLTFAASVKAGADEVLRGTHERFVVTVDKVRERLLKKRAEQEHALR
jgi:fluoroacetyl-CoA thioesterase